MNTRFLLVLASGGTGIEPGTAGLRPLSFSSACFSPGLAVQQESSPWQAIG